MNTFAVVILVALVGEYLLGAVSGLLSSRSFGHRVPAEFTGVFNDDKYARAQRYTATRARFGLVRWALGLAAMLTFWFAGGFGWLDSVVRGLGKGPVVTGLFYIGAIMLAGTLFQLPFRAWSTFVIEGRYGFNRTTAGTFGADLLKGAAVTFLLGGPLLAVILAFFEAAGPPAWIWCWIAVTAFTLAVQFIGPTWIMPLFNTFTPLDDGKLHDAILGYARSAGFPLEGIFVVDGSRRSPKPNAFFTGFGKHKRIGLFDTLVEEYAAAEVVAVEAHEIGHYKKRHVWLQLALSIGHIAAMLWILSLFLGQQSLYAAFDVAEPSVYAGFVFFSLLLRPVDLVLSVLMHVFSRRHEFEADRFAAETTGSGAPLVGALKKLAADNLSNLTPHPMDVFLHYSHPPVLQRIGALGRLSERSASPSR